MTRTVSNVGRLIAGLLVCTLALPMAAGAQGGEIQILEVDNTNHPRIELRVAIPPELGTGPLSGSDFALAEEGITQPAAVTAETNQVQVVLAIDTSGSMKPTGALAVAKAAASQLIQSLPEEARVGVIGFGSEVLVAAPMTAEKTAAIDAIASLDFSGDTALWDSLIEASSLFEADDDQSSLFVVVLTDGTNDGGAALQSDAVSALEQAGASIYAIGLQTAATDFTELESVVDEIGGGFRTAEGTEALAEVFTDLSDRLNNRYRITFDAAGTGEREVILSVATEGGLAVTRQVLDLGGTPDAIAEDEVVAQNWPSQLGSRTAPGVTGIGQNWVLWAGAGFLFVALAIIALVMLRPAVQVRMAGAAPTPDNVSGLTQKLSSSAERFMAGSESGGRLDASLDAAGMEIRPGEIVVLTGALMLAISMLIGWASTPLVGILAAAIVPMVSWAVVSRKLRKRRDEFAEQLSDTLNIMAGALRAGRGLPQCIDLVAQEADSPTSDEFRRVIIESRIGRDITVSLQSVAQRMDNVDFYWFAEAVGINRELGGDLAEVLDNIGSLVRDRTKMKMHVKALAAEGRLSAMVLIILPILLFFYLQIVNPEYGGRLLNGPGLVMLALGMVAMGAGSLWIRNLVRLDY